MKELKSAPPKKCIHCKMTPEKMQEKYDIGFLLFAEPGSTMMFFQCPNCHAIMGNIHAADNTKIILKERENRKSIITPKSDIIKPQKSNLLILPGKN